MHTYQIHIKGMVQGVGFRPMVCRMAEKFRINGFVSNTCDGVHIEYNAHPEQAEKFYKEVIASAPRNALITAHQKEEIPIKIFASFGIRQAAAGHSTDMLLTPDMAICDSCRHEILDETDRRYRYAFTTCLNCGPRYSIIKALPYDREHTTMDYLEQCHTCHAEYHNIHDHRHYSQTNSCPDCAVAMHLYSGSKTCISSGAEEVLALTLQALKDGRIVAVKGVGGYLLLCDATNATAVHSLRVRKQRPAKPLALLYSNMEMADGDVVLHSYEINALHDKAAPIVLCRIKSHSQNEVCRDEVAPGLDTLGIMLPSSPLLFLLAHDFNKPLVATSGNISGAPVIYKDKEALLNLFEVADFVLTYDRDIVAPQDDSVLQFTASGQKMILRRSRGLAPNYHPDPFTAMSGTILAMGAELKSAFALKDEQHVYVSQYLGAQGAAESHQAYKNTLDHLTQLLRITPDHILVDQHPGYFVSEYGRDIAAAAQIPVTVIQHHKAHFGAVLAENHLLETEEPVLGFIWDGTGYGSDGQVWGGEVFLFHQRQMERVAHLDYFPQLLGDKMSREPRLAALSLLKSFPQHQSILQPHFSLQEWKYYQQLIGQPAQLLTSSMGRFLDAVAAILGICHKNTYEGEAAIKLEVLARNCMNKVPEAYPVTLQQNRINWNECVAGILLDVQQHKDITAIAWKVMFTLFTTIKQAAHHFNIKRLAFSGGVFQNALLVHLITEQMSATHELYFHRHLSPNDECIAFGQMACLALEQAEKEVLQKQNEKSAAISLITA
ncbi:MAG: carbamoyltransferase HypF [Bacteroidetes bacterium]|nr:carbamoyltransferase HypF [Bacteroidota bacterium]